jgi:hypothetical protein
MASHRPLTPNEIAELKARFLPARRFMAADLKFLLVLVGAGLALSTPVAILFFCAARFMHGRSVEDALQIGLLGFLPGAGLGAIFAVMGWVGANRPTLPGLKQELARGECAVHVHRAVRAWHLVDQGNAEDPDLLLDLGRGRVLALYAPAFAGAGEARETCTIEKLPRSGALVALSFSGAPIPIGDAPVVTDQLWRHDDLPYLEPISVASAPGELRAALERAG